MSGADSFIDKLQERQQQKGLLADRIRTKEMEEDGKWGLLALSVKLAGKRLAENETNLIIAQLDNATNTVTGGASLTIANITRAMQYLDDADYDATTILVLNKSE